MATYHVVVTVACANQQEWDDFNAHLRANNVSTATPDPFDSVQFAPADRKVTLTRLEEVGSSWR
jgi:hypothetical protein